MDRKFMKNLLEKIAKEDEAEHVNVQDKVKLVNDLCDYLKETVSDGVSVTAHINEPFKSMGYISVCGKDIIFDSPEAVAAASAMASNVEIYPKTNGTVEMNFTFHGVAKKCD